MRGAERPAESSQSIPLVGRESQQKSLFNQDKQAQQSSHERHGWCNSRRDTNPPGNDYHLTFNDVPDGPIENLALLPRHLAGGVLAELLPVNVGHVPRLDVAPGLLERFDG